MQTEAMNSCAINENSILENWKEESYTSNQIIDAYEQGKKEGMSFQEKIFREKFEENASLAIKGSEELYQLFLKLDIIPDARLRVNNIASFDFAFLIDEESFNSDEIDSTYEQAHHIRERLKTDTFSIYFYLFPKTKTFDLNRLISDGFTHRYAPNESKTTVPRSSNS